MTDLPAEPIGCPTPGACAATDTLERHTEALQSILLWCEAYPASVFVQPDLAEVQRKLGAETMTALHGSWARHLLTGIAGYARVGLGITAATDA